MNGYWEVYRGVANAWECDIMGHLNVQFYTGKTSEAMAHLRAAIGLAPSVIRRDRLSAIAVHARSRYLRELQAGDILFSRAGLLEADEKTLLAHVEIVNAESGEVACEFELRTICFDLDARRAVPWPEAVRARIDGLLTERRSPARPPSTDRPGMAPPPGRALAAPFVSAQGSVMKWECDEFEHMSAQFFVTRASDAVGHVKAAFGLDRASARANDWGTAALEYSIHFLREMKAGDIWRLESGLLDVGRKTFRFGHRLYNVETGGLCATYDAVGCLFDLRTRRSLELPDSLRERVLDHLIAWPPEEIAGRLAA